MNRYKVGMQAFIIESNNKVRSVTIIGDRAGLYTIKFEDSNGAIRVKDSRLYNSIEAAEQTIGIRREAKKPKAPRPPHRIW